jgi:hypothetical protein
MNKTVAYGPDGKIVAYHCADGRLARIVTYRPNGKPKYVQLTEGGMKFQWGKLTKQEQFEFYKAAAPGKNFQMLAPSLNSRRTSGSAAGATSQEEESSSSSPAEPAQGTPPSGRG